MDCLPRFYCDGRVVTIPKGFRVRCYNNSLNYNTHNVIRYHTDHSHTFVFCMMKSTGQVKITVTNDDIVARVDRLGSHRYNHYNASTPIENIVCSMLTEQGRLIVPDSNSNSVDLTLF